MQLVRLWKTLTRKKPLNQSYFEKSDLPRVLGLVDLTALGVASTLGMGVYIMAGSIAKIAGPAVTVSFFIAGIAAALSALCYGEFAARVPKAGSAYVYSYVAVGEFIAFIVGWNIALECIIGTACVARALSGYIDSLIELYCDVRISKYLSELLPMDYPYLSSYPDLFSFSIMIAFSCLLAFGVMFSSNFNKLFTFLNLTTISIVILAGAYKANLHNWSLSRDEVPASGGAGGFLPFGFVSIFRGAAKCFYAYTGFDGVATTGDEAKNPQRNVPLALILTLVIAFAAYLGISTSLTLMWPYFDQDVVAPFPYAFTKVHLLWVKWVVTSGALFALFASMVSSIYASSRILYSMACDGLLFESLSYVNKRFETPLVSIAVVGILTGLISVIFDVEMLVDMSSIGTLTAYTLVSVCVLLLRYETQEDASVEEQITKVNVNDPPISARGVLNGSGFGAAPRGIDISDVKDSLFKTIFNLDYLSETYRNVEVPTRTTSVVVKWMTFTMVVSLVAFCLSIIQGYDHLCRANPVVWTLAIVSGATFLLSVASIKRQPQSKENLTFKVRYVPLIPVTSTVMNIALMMMLNVQTWIRFLVWMLFGFLIYFSYGIKHSKESLSNRKFRSNINCGKTSTDFGQ